MPLPLTIYLALAAPASELEAKVKAIFEEHCTACHDNGGEEPSLAGAPSRLKSVKSKATGKPMVAAGDPDGSYLLAKINGKNITGDAMPLGGDPLPAAQKSTIKEWIASLAPATVPTPPAAASKPAAATTGGSDEAAKRVAELEPKVKKIFADQCLSCHDTGSDDIVLAGSPERLLKETSKATKKPILVAGDADNSYLIMKVSGAKGIARDGRPYASW